MKPPSCLHGDGGNGCLDEPSNDDVVVENEDGEEEHNTKSGTRPDRAARLIARKNIVETVIKSSLLKYVNGDDAFKQRFVIACRRRVDAFSKRVVMASIRMHGLVKHAFASHEDVRHVQLPDIFDQTFVRQLMLGTEDAAKPDPAIVAYLQAHPDDLERFVGGRFEGDRNVYSYGAAKYITNMKNAFKVTFRQRLLSFLKRIVQPDLSITNEQRAATLYHIAGWKMPSNLQKVDVSDVQLQAVIFQHRNLLGLSKKASIDDNWFDRKKNLLNVLRQWVSFNRAYESRGLPLFTIVPACKIRHHFITIDTSSLFGILKEMGCVSGGFDVFDSIRKEQWYSVLDLDQFKRKAQVQDFSFIIDTDSVSVCTHWHRPKAPSSKPAKKAADGDQETIPPLDSDAYRVIAIDPGRVIIYYAVEQTKEGRFKTYTLTRRQYYAASGVFAAREHTKRWQESIQDALEAFSRVSIKGVDVQKHQEYLDTYHGVASPLWTEYTKSRWARQRLRLYGGKKRAFASFFNEVITGDDRPELNRPVVIAYGAANVGTGGKGELSAPSSRAFKECQARYKCRAVDEFRSSKTFYGTGDVLKLVSVAEQRNRGLGNIVQRSKPLRGLLWYDSTSDKSQSKFIGRDFNAAINIWRCATETTRPLALTRVSGQPKIVQSVGKVIIRRN